MGVKSWVGNEKQEMHLATISLMAVSILFSFFSPSDTIKIKAITRLPYGR